MEKHPEPCSIQCLMFNLCASIVVLKVKQIQIKTKQKNKQNQKNGKIVTKMIGINIRLRNDISLEWNVFYPQFYFPYLRLNPTQIVINVKWKPSKSCDNFFSSFVSNWKKYIWMALVFWKELQPVIFFKFLKKTNQRKT